MRVCLHPKFPDNREKYRENRKIRPEIAKISSPNAASMLVFDEIAREN
jgi:hypothetical protein